MINNFGDPEETAERLRALGCINIAESFYLKNQTRNDIDKCKHKGYFFSMQFGVRL